MHLENLPLWLPTGISETRGWPVSWLPFSQRTGKGWEPREVMEAGWPPSPRLVRGLRPAPSSCCCGRLLFPRLPADGPQSARLLQGLAPDLRPSPLSAGSGCDFPAVLCPCPGQKVLRIDFSDRFSSHPRCILWAMSLGLFCYGNGLVVVQFSPTVMLTCYLLHYLWHNSNTIIKNAFKDARWYGSITYI